ncbi:serine/threonine-protein kinase Nek8-like [Schistocerca piceifrons]|uniref:serine/threonine-protein kinase Nek8-like n=1 Tax=Schistocerca piceifrons TaxID=274613 RepID=UPI001F5F71C9|nr:serine/threonine-protein kinase Nek8-like [Schistocerca piceifrons]
MECYREIRVVGRGSFGAVHLCERRSDGQRVVVKRVSISQMTDSELADVVTWASQLVLALYHIHSLNVLHRDITSSNILLTANHRCLKIGDFGISKILASITLSTAEAGPYPPLWSLTCNGSFPNESCEQPTGVSWTSSIVDQQVSSTDTSGYTMLSISRAV